MDENADLVKITMRLNFSLQRQWLIGEREEKKDLITKQLNLEASATSDLVARYQTATSDLISKVRIWEKIEKKQEDKRKKAEIEQERRNVKEMINSQTTKLKKLMSRRWKAVTKMMKESETQNRQRRPLQKFSSIQSAAGVSSLWSSFEGNDQADDFDELIRNARSMISFI